MNIKNVLTKKVLSYLKKKKHVYDSVATSFVKTSPY